MTRKSEQSEFPYYLRERLDDGEIWYEILPEDKLTGLALKEGDYVNILARVGTMKRIGGYTRGETPPPGLKSVPKIEKGYEGARRLIRLDPTEIFIVGWRAP